MNRPTDYPIADVIRAAEYRAYIEVIVLCPYCKQHHNHALLEWATEEWYARRCCKDTAHALKKQGRPECGRYYFLAPRNVPQEK